MASVWGFSWGSAWGNAWGTIDPYAPVDLYPGYALINTRIREMLYNINPQMPFVIRGVQYPTQYDDFLEVNVLNITPQTSSRWRKFVKFAVEIKCFSKHTNIRGDNNGEIDPHFTLAKPYIDLLNQRRHIINNTCIQFNEPKIVNLDLKSLGDFAKSADQQSPSLNLFVLAIQITGTINRTKE
jgi:hypothetical protein